MYEVEFTVEATTYHFGSVKALRDEIEAREFRIRCLDINAATASFSKPHRKLCKDKAEAQRVQLFRMNRELAKLNSHGYENE